MVACFAIASITILPSAFQVTSSSNVDTLTQSLPSSLQLTKWWSVETSTETDSEDKSNEDQDQEDPSGKPWVYIRNTTHYTGYRYVNKLIKCVPNKVSSSANREIYDQWKQLPVLSNSASSETRRFSYAVIRDPLGRLYSGYWNKCLHSSSKEDHCVHFTKKRPKGSNSSSTNPLPPPTFLQFLQRNYLKDKFHKLHQNSHYQPIVKLCRHQNIENTTRLQQHPQQQQQQQHELLSTYDHVFDMASPDYNNDMNDFWKRVGAPHQIVDAFFPTTERRKLSWYHSGSVDATKVMNSYTQNNTNTEACQTLQLAMIATSDDYNYASHYFPKPQWATSILNDCPEFNDSIVVDTYYSTYNGTSDDDVVVEHDDTKTLRHLRKKKAELTSRITKRHNDHHNDIQRKRLRVKMREKVLSKLRMKQSLENEEGVMVMLL
jgi:hypothetical protein